MKSTIDIFTTLSKQLTHFGSEPKSQAIIELAIAENSWFTREDIIYAVDAIRSEMLDGVKLERWLTKYTSRDERLTVLVIMAGNIPLVGFLDLLCTIAAGCECHYKPSSKDRVLIGYFVELLKVIEPDIPIYIYDEASCHPQRVIATGGESAALAFKTKFGSLPTLIRSSRHSIAVVESAAELASLTDDIYRYSGLGCRNVSMIFAPEGLDVNIERVSTSGKYRNNYLQTRALLTLSGREFIDSGSSCLTESKEFARTLSTISIYRYKRLEELEGWIESHDEQIQCIATSLIDHPRAVTIGSTQRPTLDDYPDAIDVMKFLTK